MSCFYYQHFAEGFSFFNQFLSPAWTQKQSWDLLKYFGCEGNMLQLYTDFKQERKSDGIVLLSISSKNAATTLFQILLFPQISILGHYLFISRHDGGQHSHHNTTSFCPKMTSVCLLGWCSCWSKLKFILYFDFFNFNPSEMECTLRKTIPLFIFLLQKEKYSQSKTANLSNLVNDVNTNEN